MPLQNRQTALTRADARADDQRREIAFGNQSVVIARRVSGIAMRVRVPLCSYRGVALSLAEERDGEAVHRIELLHRDPDLSIPLVEAGDVAEIAAEWAAWAEGLALPRLIERAPGEVEAVEAMGQGVFFHAPASRIGSRAPPHPLLASAQDGRASSGCRSPIAANARSSHSNSVVQYRLRTALRRPLFRARAAR